LTYQAKINQLRVYLKLIDEIANTFYKVFLEFIVFFIVELLTRSDESSRASQTVSSPPDSTANSCRARIGSAETFVSYNASFDNFVTKVPVAECEEDKFREDLEIGFVFLVLFQPILVLRLA